MMDRRLFNLSLVAGAAGLLGLTNQSQAHVVSTGFLGSLKDCYLYFFCPGDFPMLVHCDSIVLYRGRVYDFITCRNITRQSREVMSQVLKHHNPVPVCLDVGVGDSAKFSNLPDKSQFAIGLLRDRSPIFQQTHVGANLTPAQKRPLLSANQVNLKPDRKVL